MILTRCSAECQKDFEWVCITIAVCHTELGDDSIQEIFDEVVKQREELLKIHEFVRKQAVIIKAVQEARSNG